MALAMNKDLLVIALGGNALLSKGQKGTFEEQYRNIKEASSNLVDLLELGYKIVITHGNGPQVGSTLLRHEAGYRVYDIPPFPMHACGAETQGFIGYIIQQAVQNELNKRGIRSNAVTVITRVEVDPNDPAFKNPSKPVGPYYTQEEVRRLMSENPEFTYAEDSGRGWRRVVPSPLPVDIKEKDAIKLLVDAGFLVISTGGGGIPVMGKVEASGLDAVIDKDLAGQKLGSLLGASKFIMLTDVDAAYLNFGSPSQSRLNFVKYSEMKKYYDEGHFRSGSMGPKVKASLKFIEEGGAEAIIAHLKSVKEALMHGDGTHVVPD